MMGLLLHHGSLIWLWVVCGVIVASIVTAMVVSKFRG